MTREEANGCEVTLLPCPFCGGEKARTIHIRDGRKAVCPCGACGKPCFHGPMDMPSAEVRAIEAWNTRASTASQQADLAEALGALREATKRSADLPNKAEYQKGWNDARFRARQIAEPILAKHEHKEASE